ncbi:hypothetical protein [Streptomyces sp. NBC_01483]|uniref:hypothetical protein n=1 Tax=Streptomyces sp. NBC_01483 TaxID=2903883 RepID=UPI002E34C62E|nr:hypothetical protein [Streptomyces sp. NBC_01483]
MRARVAERLKHQANWTPAPAPPAPTTPSLEARVATLEKQVADYAKRIVALEKKAA